MLTVVLVVDSDTDNRDLCAAFLSSKGYVTITATTAEEALPLISDADVVITETRLSGPLNGFDLMSAVRRNTHTRDVPIIALTASVFDDVRNRALASGATFFLRKPCMLADLLSRVRRVIRVAQPASARAVL